MAEAATISGGSRISRDDVVIALQEYGVYAAIIILVVVDTLLQHSFFSMANLRVQLLQAVPVLVVALGMAIVIGTEGIDLSVGAVIGLAAAFIPLYLGYGVYQAIAVALIAGLVSGVVAGSIVAFGKVQPIVATLALMIGLRGLAQLFNGGSQTKTVTNDTIANLGTGNWFGIPEMAWFAAVIVLIIMFLIRRTTFGRQLMAVGDNRAASILAGLPVKRILITAYAISGLLAAFAGILLVGYGGDADPANSGLNYELMAITAVVVGGTPLTGGKIRVLGTVAGALFMQLVQATLIQHDVSQSIQQLVEAVIIVAAVYAARGRSGR